MILLHRSEVPTAELGDAEPKERRFYYQSDEHLIRMVTTEIPPGHTQKEHAHAVLLDITYVIRGAVEVADQTRSGVRRTATLGPGDVAIFTPSDFHSMRNASATEPAETFTVKIPAGWAQISPAAFAQLCSSDWIPFAETTA
jgi:quercetin dioxygenase-like cupin family protein